MRDELIALGYDKEHVVKLALDFATDVDHNSDTSRKDMIFMLLDALGLKQQAESTMQIGVFSGDLTRLPESRDAYQVEAPKGESIIEDESNVKEETDASEESSAVS